MRREERFVLAWWAFCLLLGLLWLGLLAWAIIMLVGWVTTK